MTKSDDRTSTFGLENADRAHAQGRAEDLEVLFGAAERAIQGKRPDQLKELLEQEPELVRARNESGEDLLNQTLSYANFVGDEAGFWTSTPCAQVLVRAGAEVTTHTCLRAMYTGDAEMVRMFLQLGAIPSSLRNASAAGDPARVRALFEADGRLTDAGRPAPELHERHVEVPDPQDEELVIADAFRLACRCGNPEVAAWLLDRAFELDKDLERKIQAGGGTGSLVGFLLENRGNVDVLHSLPIWESAQLVRLHLALQGRDAASFRRVLEAAPRFLSREHLSLQNHLIENCAYGRGADLARALVDLGADIMKKPPQDSRALVYAIDYGDRKMIDLLIPHWKPRDELPTWAGLGHEDKVRSFFDAKGRLKPHRAEVYPESAEPENPKDILVHALGLACMNGQLEIADFLLGHEADVNAPWGLHEPATILHEVATNGRLEPVLFLLGRGADVTIRDERFGGTALEWAMYMEQKEAQDLLSGPTVAADFFSAVQFGSLDEIKEHLKKGQDVNAQLDFVQTQGVRALFFAVYQDRPEVVEYLLQEGADAGACDGHRRGAFHRLQGNSEHAERIARVLIEHGADVKGADDRGGHLPGPRRSAGVSELGGASL